MPPRRLLTRGFQTAWKAFSEWSANTEGLGADPAIETNGISTLSQLAITARPETGDVDVVNVTFYQSADRTRARPRLQLDMKREDGRWRIDDIRSDLTVDLRNEIAAPR